MLTLAYVRFPWPEGWDEAKLLAKFNETAALYTDVDGLVRKDYHMDAATRMGGGLYYWRDEAKARAFHAGDWLERLQTNYGGAPDITWLKVPVTADALAHKVIQHG